MAIYLLAWHGGELVGRATLLRTTKYEKVSVVLGAIPEVNALASFIEGRGTATAIMREAELQAGIWDAEIVGLGVEASNHRARRLYEFLGYKDWGYGSVTDSWDETSDEGEVTERHADQCLYLTRRLLDP